MMIVVYFIYAFLKTVAIVNLNEQFFLVSYETGIPVVGRKPVLKILFLTKPQHLFLIKYFQ